MQNPLAVPGTLENPTGEVDEIEPAGQILTRIFPTTCSPAGLVLVPRHRLATSCGDVINIGSGKVLTTVGSVGGGEIWFNHGEERVYFGGFQAIRVPILNTDNNELVTTLVVGQINPNPPAESDNPLGCRRQREQSHLCPCQQRGAQGVHRS